MSAAVQSQQDALAARLARWREGGPVLFAIEALQFPPHWDEATHSGVQPWWWEANDKLIERRKLTIRSGHGAGKSAFLAITIMWFLYCHFPAKVPCTAPSAHQLEDVLWPEVFKWLRKLRELNPWLGEQIDWTKERIFAKEAPLESFAVARTARAERPEALQGFHSENILFVIDEASGVPEPVYEVAQGALSSEGAYVIMVGNPTRASGFFYDSHHKFRSRYGVVHVDCSDSRRVPTVSTAYVEDVIAKYGVDSNFYRVRVKGDFPKADDDVVIPLYLCEEAQHREVEPFGEIRWGLDCARFGDDRSVLIKRCQNAVLEPHKAWRNKETMQLAQLVYLEYMETPPSQKPRFIFVDVIGIGAGVYDRLVELGMPAVPVNVAESPAIKERFFRQRDELWWMAREWLESRRVRLDPTDDTLVAELTLPKYRMHEIGQIRVERKDEMKKRGVVSPDVADAFIITFAAGFTPAETMQAPEPEVFPDS